MTEKKFFAELFGTFMLVFVGCGMAMLFGCDPNTGNGYLFTALAFGLVIIAMAYSVGNVSGCHINPAVSLAMAIRREIGFTELIGYLFAQVMGACFGSLANKYLWQLAGLTDKTGAYGSNSLAGVNGNIIVGLVVEAALTFIFVFAVIGATAKIENKATAGLVIGLTLILVHLIGIQLTGTSVNPARSFGPALVALLFGDGAPMSQMWIFAAGPFAGALLATGAYALIEDKDESTYY